MAAKRLDGKATAATMRAEIAARSKALAIVPKLVAVLVGENPASRTYVTAKRKACTDAGLASELIELPVSVSEAELLGIISGLNQDATVHGILVQLPLPRQINESAVIEAVAAHKDVDCFHPENVGRLMTGQPRFYPCTPYGVVELVRRHGISWAGAQVVVVGRSNIVGKPLAMMLAQKPTKANPAGGDATVTIAHTQTKNLAAVCQSADILVAAAGQPGMITPSMVRQGAVVVDVGTSVVTGKLRGDVDPDVEAVAAWMSPVPGGVGPMTITMLLLNTLNAAELSVGPGRSPA
jgi:methylenetetrahydrofolate dehydrogenase (NADP+) / methenyltetrahydrofolate cyclohydrolase